MTRQALDPCAPLVRRQIFFHEPPNHLGEGIQLQGRAIHLRGCDLTTVLDSRYSISHRQHSFLPTVASENYACPLTDFDMARLRDENGVGAQGCEDSSSVPQIFDTLEDLQESVRST